MRFVARLLLNLLRWSGWLLGWPFRKFERRAPWLVANLGDRLTELAPPSRSLLKRFSRDSSAAIDSVQALRSLVANFERLRPDLGLVLHVRQAATGWATLESAREALLTLRARGRHVVVFLEEGADERALFLAAAADRVWLGKSAGITALGPLSRRTFVGPLLHKIGVEVAVSAAGDYKSAADGLVRASMSGPDREQRTALLAAILGRWNEALDQRRAGLAARLLDAAVSGPEHALALGAVDHLGYVDELEEALGIATATPAFSSQSFSGAARIAPWRRLRSRPHIAVVRLAGAIGGRGVGLKPTRILLRKLVEDDDVAAVVLMIDSPGGSAVVSDLLHREISRVDAKKPVVSVFGDVAASGGYYLAAATRRIWARATTVTGSIGVISVRAAVGALLERFGVHVESLALTPAADLFRFTTPLTPAEARLFEAETERFYARFLDVVAHGRKRSLESVTRVAGGRVWAGRDALEIGLVDAIGGIPDAIAHLRSELAQGGVEVDSEVRHYAARGAPGLVPKLTAELAEAFVSTDLEPLYALAELTRGNAGRLPLTYLLQ